MTYSLKYTKSIPVAIGLFFLITFKNKLKRTISLVCLIKLGNCGST